MKTIAVSNGDIQLDSGKLSFVTGTSKLAQDLGRWLREPLGTGFSTPGFGSVLPSVIGQPLNDGLVATVQNEIQRVVTLYQAMQVQNISSSQTKAQLANWNKNEVVQNIISLDVDQYNDGLYAYLVVQTLNGTQVQLNISIERDGVEVQNG